MPKKLMILGASILQLPAIKKAKEMGLNVVVVDMNPNAVGFKEDGIEKEVVSTLDIPKVIEAAKKHKIDGIMTLASDMPMRTVAAVAKEMSLVGIDEETAIRATNKYEMREALKKEGVPIPVFYRLSDESDISKISSFFNGKFIVKPVDNSGSRGIFLVDDISKAKDAFLFSKAHSRKGDVLFEEYMEGPEVSVETISLDGVCHVIQITDKLTTGAPHFVEIGHSQPSQLSIDIQEAIKEVAIKANKAIGISNGPSHTEIIVTKDGPKVVELGARLGGDCITSHLVPLSTGVNMVEACIKIALGDKPDIVSKYKKGSAIRYFSQNLGTIKTISHVNDALKSTGIINISFVKHEGDTISSIVDSASRIGFVIAQDKNVQTAISDCVNAIKKIKIVIE